MFGLRNAHLHASANHSLALGEAVDGSAMSLTSKKLILTFGMLVATLFTGLIPLRLTASSFRKFLPFLSCFSGGVFMAACLMDLFPDVEESVNHVLDEIEKAYGVSVDYPVAEAIIVLGFLLVLLVEQSVLKYQENLARRDYTPIPGNNGDSDSWLETNGASGDGGQQQQHQHNDHQVNPDVRVEGGRGHGGEGHGENGHSHSHAPMEQSSLRAIILTVALSFHSLFEGLAIGLQTSADAMISLLCAVVIHKGVMAFSLGLNIVQSNLSRKSFFVSLLIFSVASPLGVVIGILITNLQQSIGRDVANAFLQGISGGTFLYITFFEVLPHELNQPGNRIWKVLSVVVGVLAISGVLCVTH